MNSSNHNFANLLKEDYRYTGHCLQANFRLAHPRHPDIVLVRHKKVIFVHGCFWHVHRCRYGRVKPATHKKFWQDKRQGNVERDKRNLRKLRKAGWKVLVIWECQTRHLQKLTKKLQRFISS